jgi:hypothetical protein
MDISSNRHDFETQPAAEEMQMKYDASPVISIAAVSSQCNVVQA